ncbi:MAG TPA: tyrosine-type recombinase/integrase [Microbacterium sp.]|uniref:tyrosine-type recombinase/integrase n=1 Tax=Microbacterium sp. TaxID=51671 RepID=UPI002B496A48|nr:tyrosine-type recombinase/integrase [Microbacterium sp.]HKT56656.1 tyrosine-type recombinase/integrase [Microbacterium sp.]
MRSGEARALRWEYIDLDAGIAELSWSLTEGTFAHGCRGTCGKKTAGSCPSRRLELAAGMEWAPLEGHHVLVRPKNGTARQVPLTAAAVAQLRLLRETDEGPNPHGLVWHRPGGSPKTNVDDNVHLRAALSLEGVDRPDATTHWLRHSYVTLSEHAGIPWAAYSGVSGHSSPEASDPYRHTLTAEGRRVVESLADFVDS